MLAPWRRCSSELKFHVIDEVIIKDKATDALSKPEVGNEDCSYITDNFSFVFIDLDERNLRHPERHPVQYFIYSTKRNKNQVQSCLRDKLLFDKKTETGKVHQHQ